MWNKAIESAIKLSETLESLSDPIDLFILFIDLCDSTEIKQYCFDNEIPDSIWIMRQKVFLSRTARIIQQYKGNIIKTIGDEIMATFPFETTASDILKCSIEVFQTFSNLKSYNKGKFKIFSKASIDFGTCFDGQLLEKEIFDPIGYAVDRCARIGKYISKNEICFSDDFYSIIIEQNYDFKDIELITAENEMKGLGIVKYHKFKV